MSVRLAKDRVFHSPADTSRCLILAMDTSGGDVELMVGWLDVVLPVDLMISLVGYSTYTHPTHRCGHGVHTFQQKTNLPRRREKLR